MEQNLLDQKYFFNKFNIFCFLGSYIMDNTNNFTYNNTTAGNTFFPLNHTIFGSENDYNFLNNAANSSTDLYPAYNYNQYTAAHSTVTSTDPSTCTSKTNSYQYSNSQAPQSSSTISHSFTDDTSSYSNTNQNASLTPINEQCSKSPNVSNKSVSFEDTTSDDIDVEQTEKTHTNKNSNDSTKTLLQNNIPNDLVTTMNLALYNILYEMNPENAALYYNKCHFAKVNENQIIKLTEFQISRMFTDSEIGLMADFTYDLNKYKNQGKLCTSNSNPKEIPSALLPTSNGNPNCLLKIISSDVALYRKAIKRSENNDKTLTPLEESKLLNLIKHHFINRCNKQMSHDDMRLLSEQIEQFFPGESKFTFYKTDYKTVFNKKGEKVQRNRVSGKLVNKWTNRKEKEPRKRQAATDSYYTMPVIFGDFTDFDHQDRLRLNLSANQNYPINVILNDWKNCQQLRLQSINKNKEKPGKIFEEWPFYEHGDGHILVSIKKKNNIFFN